MADYDPFARFYDAVMGDPEPRLAALRRAIGRHKPSARSLLELGCGTGTVLAGLRALPDRTGVDRSAAMLQLARQRVPDATLVEADMSTFHSDRCFDVVACVHDSLNHLARVEDWKAVVARTAEHLAGDGIFHFDVNTVGRLRRLAAGPAWVHDFEGHTLVMDVQPASRSVRAPAKTAVETPTETHVRTAWHLRVFEPLHGRRFTLHETTIAELALPIDELTELLRPRFTVLECVDGAGDVATDDSDRAYLTCRLRAP